jgi:hypothetical protein
MHTFMLVVIIVVVEDPLVLLSSSSLPWNDPILASIDFAALVLFAGIGKANHDTTGSIDIPSTLMTAAPFLLSWYATSPLTRIYSTTSTSTMNTMNKNAAMVQGSDNQGNGILEAGKIAARGWIIAIPLGCVLRGIMKGYIPPAPFVIVTMVATLFILAGARMLYAAFMTKPVA